MPRCVIIGGADIADYPAVKKYLRPGDFFIFCDSGLKHQKPLSVEPDLIVGDFDSAENPHSAAETIVLPTVKDDTDTVFAVKEALRRGFDDFLLIGVIGRRLDHTLGNIYILLNLHNLGKHGLIVDDYSEMEIAAADPVYVSPQFPYFSLINISGSAKKITVKNAKYPLENAEIPPHYQYGISNEPLKDAPSEITVLDGCALLIRIRNE